MDYVPYGGKYKLRVDFGIRKRECCYSEIDERSKFIKEFTLCVYVGGRRISEYFVDKDFKEEDLPIITSKLEELAKFGANVEELNSAITTVLMNLYYESNTLDPGVIIENGIKALEE